MDPLCPLPTVFHEEWWLHAATGGMHRWLEVAEGGAVARMPLWLARRHGALTCDMPVLTHALGPVVAEGSGNATTRRRRRVAVVRALARAVPRVALFRHVFHLAAPEPLGFQAEGYDMAVQYTLRLAAAPGEATWKAMRDKTRNVIRRAEEGLAIDAALGSAEFLAFYAENLKAAGQRPYFDLSLAGAVVQAAMARGQGGIVGVRDGHGRLQAATFMAWDAPGTPEGTTYYVMSSRQPEAHSGATSLLVWQAIQAAAARGQGFDFDGLASPGGLPHYLGFGGVLVPRFLVHRRTPAVALLGQLQALFGRQRVDLSGYQADAAA
jgi:hypothetical protein